MKFSTMTPQELQNALNWCSKHDWGINAQYDQNSGKITNLSDVTYDYVSKQTTTNFVSFDDFLDLRIWAGY